MAQASGAKSRILFAWESAYGTPGADAYVLPFNTFTLSGSQAKNTPATIRGNRNPFAPFAGNIDAGGQVVVPMDWKAMFFWLSAMFNEGVESGTADPWTYTFTVHDEQPSFALEKQHTDISTYWRYTGCKVSKASFQLGGDGELTCAIDILASEETLPAAAMDAAPTSITLGRLGNFQASVKLGGVASSIVRTCTINLDFGLDGDQRVIGGGGKRGGLPEGILNLSGDIELLYEDDTYVDLGAANTETSLAIEIMNSDAHPHGLKFYFDEIEFSRFQAPINGPQGVTLQGTFHPFLDDDVTASAVWVELITSADQSAYNPI